MPSVLLDHLVTEAAMRPSTTPSRHRWSRRQARASVASVVAAAPVVHRQPAAVHLTGLKRLDNNPLDFSDLRNDADYTPEWARLLTVVEQTGLILAAAKADPSIRCNPEFLARLAPIAAVLAKPMPRGDWQEQTDTVLAATFWRISTLPIGDWYRRVIRIENDLAEQIRVATATVIYPARALQDDLIADMADSIAAAGESL